MKSQSFCLQHDLIKKITLSLCPSNIIVGRMPLGHSGFEGVPTGIQDDHIDISDAPEKPQMLDGELSRVATLLAKHSVVPWAGAEAGVVECMCLLVDAVHLSVNDCPFC